MKNTIRLLVILLSLAVILGCAACGTLQSAAPETAAATETPDPAEIPADEAAEEPAEASVGTGTELPGVTWPVELAEGPGAVSYPYIIRTENTVWHLSAADMELLGQEAYCEGLERTLQNQEADFADARAALAPWIQEEIPPIDIYTDFCGHAEGDEMFGAFYRGANRDIRLFHNWDMAGISLLHEYVHYLTITCTDRPVSEGLFAEGVAEYVSRFACKNRMERAASLSSLSPEEKQLGREYHLLDEDGFIDSARLYLFQAEMIRDPSSLGAKYNTITNAIMTRDERINQNPSFTTISYPEAGAILAFLVDTYGEELVFGHWDMNPADLKEIFGKDFGELYRDWADWNLMKCNELGISFG